MPLKVGASGSIQKRFQKASDSRLSGSYINSDHIQVLAGGFERLFCVMIRNKSGVVVKGQLRFRRSRSKTTSRPACFLSMRARTKSMMAMWCPG